MKNIMFRQGDVLIEKVLSLPKNLNPSKSELGKTVLAYGEVTGHHHAFELEECTKFTDKQGAEFFEVYGSPIKCRLKIIRRWKDQLMVKHPKLGIIEFAIPTITIEGEYVLIDGDFGLLKHDEHNTQAIPSGFYKGAGADNTVHQREYNPKDIRRVQD